MYNCFLMIFTAMSGVGAVTGVIAAICIFFRQKKIALFERRMKILNDFEQFVFVVLRDWNWNGSTTLVSKYSEQEVSLLFNEEYSELQKDILEVAKKCNDLNGDIDHAKRHGTCNNKTEDELQKEKNNYEEALGGRFTQKRGEAYKKWLKI